ncbi:MAG: ABC transporter substrate-binding protein [Microbacterium sp.]|uniref:ABC transporter substrate-binding protein n=1 Tax=Microbacterium sp. TaxID=51671 RepID=UPI0039E4A46B
MSPEVPRPSRRAAAALAAAVVSAVLMTGCAAQSAGTADAARADTLTVGSFSIDSVNPALVNNAVQVPRPAYETLLQQQDDGTYTGLLAESWSWDDDSYTALTMTLRDGLTFSDGDTFDADAVVGSIEYYQSAQGPHAASYAGITVEKVGDDEVRIISATANPDLPDLFADTTWGGAIISPTGVADPTSLETESHGIGEYVYSEMNAGVDYQLTANPDYPDQDAIHFDTIDFVVLATESAQTQALLSGQVELVYSTLSSTWSQTVSGSSSLTLTDGLEAWNGLQLLDRDGTVVPALGDVRVRQAIMYALDREAIATAVYGPDAQARVQAANSNWLGFDEDLESTYAYDPDKAKELLAEAGYADGFTLPVAVTAGNAAEVLAQAIGGYLSAVGITLDIQTGTDAGSTVGLLFSHTVAAGFIPNSEASVNGYLNLQLLDGAGLNTLGQVDEGLQELYSAALVANDQASWQAVLEYINENALTIPVVSAPDIWVSTDEIDVSAAIKPTNGRFDITEVVAAG